MGKVVINSYEDFEKLVGQQIGISDYVELTQERINLFCRCDTGSPVDSRRPVARQSGKPVPQHNCPRLPDAVTPSSPSEPDHRGEQPEDDD